MNAVHANPFPGLRPFREDEEYLFFGRESQVDAMVDKLTATRFLAVVGGSGSGKSSLVNCGLRPALHRGLMARAGSSWRMAQFRPGGGPLQALAAALAAEGLLYSGWSGEVPLQEVILTRLQASKRGLVDLWTKARPPQDCNLLVVVDQFEELFRYQGLAGEADERAAQATAFVNLLLETLQHPGLRLHVVITMRSDFLGECARFYGLPEAINAGQYLVPRMTREERRAAIAGPVGVGGAELDPVLLTQLLNDVGDNPDQLSILQHALHRTWALWQEAGGQGAIATAHYEACGTMAHALDQHAESAWEALGPQQQRLCERLLRALTDRGTDARGIRRPTPLGRLCEITGADEPEVRAVIDVFRAPHLSFLMPPTGEVATRDTVIDISHESLMRVWQRLRRWAEQEALSASLYRRLAQTALLAREGQAERLRGPELERALEWQRDNQPNAAWAQQYGGDFEAVVELLDTSRQERDTALRAQRLRLRRRVASAALAAVALLIFTGFLWRSERRVSEALEHAQVEAERARHSAEVAAQAQAEALRAKEAAYASARESVAARLLAEEKTRAAESEREKALASTEAAQRSEARARRFQEDAQALQARVAEAEARLQVRLIPSEAAASDESLLDALQAQPAAMNREQSRQAELKAQAAQRDQQRQAAPAAPDVAAAPAPPPVAAISAPGAPALSEAQLVVIMKRMYRHRDRPVWLRALNEAMAEFGIATVAQRAAFLAQVAYESDEMDVLEEKWGPTEFQRRYEPPGSLAQTLGNTEAGDGRRYRGRGLIQITGRRNYQALGKRIGVDLVAQPELAARPATAARLAGVFWAERGMNALADAGQLDQITRSISGGLQGMQKRQDYFDQAQTVLRAGP